MMINARILIALETALAVLRARTDVIVAILPFKLHD